MPPKLSTLIDRHENYYKSVEKPVFDKARRFYRGDFFRINAATPSNALAMLCSKNMVYAITDTAISSLLGPNPQVAAVPRNPESQEAAGAVNGLLEYIFDVNRMRRRAATTLIDAVLCKRGIFKTGWDVENDRPSIKAVDPSALFFDMTVRDADDCRYWIEATVISFDAFKERVAAGIYKIPDRADVRPDRYPRWLRPDNQQGQTDTIRDAFQWVTVYEHYDVERKIVQHYVRSVDAIVFEETLDYVPYSMYSLNQSGIDVSGISEVQLVLPQQETINDLLTHLKQISYLQIPRILYDKGLIAEEDLNSLVAAATGSYVGITPKNSEAIRSLNSLFFSAPTPDTPQGVIDFVARQENDMAYISALADANRGQVTGARTATEIAVVDAQMRTRLATREGHLNDAMEDVARKAFYLTRKHMKTQRMVRVSGSREWEKVDFASLQGVDSDFKMVGYSPLRKNPAVMIESLIQLLPQIRDSANFDHRIVDEQIAAGMGWPARALKPADQVADEGAAAQAAAEQQAMGGAAGGAPALAADAIAADEAAQGAPELPPELPAGGGAAFMSAKGL